MASSLTDRFWSKVSKDADGCWRWTASTTRDGYGQFKVAGHVRRAHRMSWEAEHGPVPDGLELDHLCRTRCCVNPEHLEAVTHAENVRRGDSPSATRERHLAVTHCPQGHEYTAGNTRYRPGRGNKRECGACNALRSQRWRNRQRETV